MTDQLSSAVSRDVLRIVMNPFVVLAHPIAASEAASRQWTGATPFDLPDLDVPDDLAWFLLLPAERLEYLTVCAGFAACIPHVRRLIDHDSRERVRAVMGETLFSAAVSGLAIQADDAFASASVALDQLLSGTLAPKQVGERLIGEAAISFGPAWCEVYRLKTAEPLRGGNGKHLSPLGTAQAAKRLRWLRSYVGNISNMRSLREPMILFAQACYAE